ncbi:MAG: carboxypeptidase M32 [Thermoplasmata archaeon]
MMKKTGVREYNDLINKYSEIFDLDMIDGCLNWDQEVMMPPAATESRAHQLATLAGIIHDKITKKRLGTLVERVMKKKEKLDDYQRANVREIKRRYDRATKVPRELVTEFSKTKTLAFEAWQKAKKEKKFEIFSPLLEKLVDLDRKIAEHVGYDKEPYDALLDEFEPGMTAGEVETIFNTLKEKQVPIIKKLSSLAAPESSFLNAIFTEDKQRIICEQIAKDLGYDFTRGRLDVSAHPFTIGCHDDVRITTRYNEKMLLSSLFSVIHETGHALYEQGLDPKYKRQPVAMSISLGIHESQSRMWENIVGRSKEFWAYYYPKLQAIFPEQLKDVPLEKFVKAVNLVKPSLIRVEADEVTYNMHIIIRFEIERLLFSNKVEVKDLPALWNSKYKEYLGIEPGDVSEGILQDVHWSMGIFGYFPTYALGNLYAAQIYYKVLEDMPSLMMDIQAGNFQKLREWLRKNIHLKGRLYQPKELIEVVTGKKPSPEYFLKYLRDKYGRLYNISF